MQVKQPRNKRPQKTLEMLKSVKKQGLSYYLVSIERGFFQIKKVFIEMKCMIQDKLHGQRQRPKKIALMIYGNIAPSIFYYFIARCVPVQVFLATQ